MMYILIAKWAVRRLMRNSRTNGAACKIKLMVELAPFTSNYKVQRNEI